MSQTADLFGDVAAPGKRPAADPTQLSEAEVAFVVDYAVRAFEAHLAKTRRPVVTSWSSLLAYLRLALAEELHEQFRVIFLDTKNRVMADEVMNRGTVNHAPVYPRMIARRALELGAQNVILIHNHPSGDPTPSQPDIDMTRQVISALRTLNMAVHDHVVVGAEGVVSFKAQGLI
ncbi:MAG TPA: DNA repair protein RadC [Caulobacteraceae bacterium]